jgi:hypothetical protein
VQVLGQVAVNDTLRQGTTKLGLRHCPHLQFFSPKISSAGTLAVDNKPTFALVSPDKLLLEEITTPNY